MSESYRKLDVPDLVITGATKPQDKSKGIMMGFIVKQRGGNDGIKIPMYVDKATSKFTVITREHYDNLSKSDEEFDEEQKDKMRKRLKGMLKKSQNDLGANRLEKDNSSKNE